MDTGDYCFRLFIAGDEPNSRLAEENLRALCLKYLAGRHHIEVIDVIENFEAALALQILVAPAVVMDSPRRVTLFGALTDEATVMAALGLKGAQHQS
ncbi:MAG: circadian clock KaiB family protein [Rhodocyclaceae bacterium]|nr:circadian clock KaiB family protein [Rhodocyclaceae bacterium]MDZ4213994.1 circadian clock KaiB family protein [Rhodocyclaceae bacterium]